MTSDIEGRLSADPDAGEEFISGLIDVRELLRDEQSGIQVRDPRKQADSHWLCELLADFADAVDPQVVFDTVVADFEIALRDAGFTPFQAGLIGAGIKKVVNGQLLAVMPTAQVALALRVLAVMLCPESDECPEGDKLGDAVSKALIADEENSR